MVYFCIEASHLFRAGDKFQTQIYVLDVVNFLRRKFYNNTDDFKVIVLHGSVKDEQAERYASALERFGVNVIRMTPIPSVSGTGKWYFKPTWYLHRMMGKEIATGSDLMLVGFHNPRYLAFLQKYAKDYNVSMAAFSTPSKVQNWMKIPEQFLPLLKNALNLDDCVADIKAEFKRKKQK